MVRIVNGEIVQDDEFGSSSSFIRSRNTLSSANRESNLDDLRRRRETTTNSAGMGKPKPSVLQIQEGYSFPQVLCNLIGIRNYVLQIPFLNPPQYLPVMDMVIFMFLYICFGLPAAVYSNSYFLNSSRLFCLLYFISQTNEPLNK